MELHELQILKWKPSTAYHGIAVTGAGVGRSAGKVSATVASSGQDRVLRAETMDRAILEANGDHATAFAIFHEQIEREVFDEIVAVISK